MPVHSMPGREPEGRAPILEGLTGHRRDGQEAPGGMWSQEGQYWT